MGERNLVLGGWCGFSPEALWVPLLDLFTENLSVAKAIGYSVGQIPSMSSYIIMLHVMYSSYSKDKSVSLHNLNL